MSYKTVKNSEKNIKPTKRRKRLWVFITLDELSVSLPSTPPLPRSLLVEFSAKHKFIFVSCYLFLCCVALIVLCSNFTHTICIHALYNNICLRAGYTSDRYFGVERLLFFFFEKGRLYIKKPYRGYFLFSLKKGDFSSFFFFFAKGRLWHIYLVLNKKSCSLFIFFAFNSFSIFLCKSTVLITMWVP